jgi:hypothetical protein
MYCFNIISVVVAVAVTVIANIFISYPILSLFLFAPDFIINNQTI